MIYIYGLISILTGAFLALKGMSNYRILLSGSVAVTNAMFFLGMADLQPDVVSPTYGMISALVGGLLTYLFYKFVTYIWTWYFIFMPTLLLSLILLGPEATSRTAGLIILILPIVGTFLLRRQIKPILVGLLSGFSVGAGATIIITAVMIENATMGSDFITMIKIPVFILIALTAGGVAFQYLVILKKNPELAKV